MSSQLQLFVDSIHPELISALEKKGYFELTPVQQAVLHPDNAGRDLRITSQTGSGKTLAIGLAVRHDVAEESSQESQAKPAVLIIVPTRELAVQVATELSWFFAPMAARVAVVTGGRSYSQELRALKSSPRIVVGTPGRLRDHLERESLSLSELRSVVLDEADQMLDLGFRDDLEGILQLAPSERRTHLVSATFAHEVKRLADKFQRTPIRVEGTPLGQANQDIEHVLHLVRAEQRFDAIVNLLLATPGAPTLIFVRTRADVTELGQKLSEVGFRMASLSGDLEQRERFRALDAFKKGHIDALVATDVAARGIDVVDIGRVIHAEAPTDAEMYTHRSGRTGRAGRKGVSSVLVTPSTVRRTVRLLGESNIAFHFEPIPSPDNVREIRDTYLVQELTTDDSPTTERLLHVAKTLLAREDHMTIVARLLASSSYREPTAPRMLEALPPPDEKKKRTPSLGTEQGSWIRFRVQWGKLKGADARRLLALLCRRGDITRDDVGAIRVERNLSMVEIRAASADAFERAVQKPDTKEGHDKDVLISRAFERTESENSGSEKRSSSSREPREHSRSRVREERAPRRSKETYDEPDGHVKKATKKADRPETSEAPVARKPRATDEAPREKSDDKFKGEKRKSSTKKRDFEAAERPSSWRDKPHRGGGSIPPPRYRESERPAARGAGRSFARDERVRDQEKTFRKAPSQDRN